MTRFDLRMPCAALVFASLVSIAGAQQVRVLFDGRTLEGWRGDAERWSVEDGAIVGRTSEAKPLARNTFLIHDGEYGDFEIRFEFLIRGGNSGLQFRSRDLGEFTVAGPQADLEAGSTYTGMIYEERGRGIMAPRGEGVHYHADGSRESLKIGDREALQAAIHNEDWNEYRVRAVGGRIVLAINGNVTAVLDDDDTAHRSLAGLFAFQLHAGPPMEIRYRNIRLIELAADAEPMPADVQFQAAPDAAKVDGSTPEWIWSTAQAGANERIVLRRTFTLASAARSIRVFATCDNEMKLRLDGLELLHDDQWESLATVAVPGPLAAGEHTLTAECTNHGGPAGFVLRAEVLGAGGSQQMIVSDRAWTWTPFDGGDAARPVHSFGPTAGSQGPWPDPFVVPTATPVSKLTAMDGYTVELVRSAGPGEGSWIALGFDPAGRAIVSRERASLARITLRDPTAGDPVAGDTAFEILEGTPRGAMGFTYLGDALFVQAQGDDGYGLFRLRDTDGDDRFDETVRLASFGGGGEHGAHAVVAGPDGMLWLMNGNMSSMPEVLAPTSPVRWQAEDVLLPRLEDPRGHAVGVRVPGGRVLRIAPDGSRVELFACGFRNSYDIAFAPDGELFTFDSDMEWDIGLPWYRPTRVYHVVSGADFGWRTGAGKWEPGYPDALPPVADVGLSSPTGVLFGTDLAFHRELRESLFLGDWAYGRILVVHLERAGASYTGSIESFLTGKPLNVTDLAAGPDGALWFTTGGRGTQSGLYRVTWNGPAVDPGEPTDWSPTIAAQTRRAMESEHAVPGPAAIDRAFNGLGSNDRFIRHAARVALEAVPVDRWRERALAERHTQSALTAWLALARTGKDTDRVAVIDHLATLAWSALEASQRLDWIRILHVGLARSSGELPARSRERILAIIDPIFPLRDLVLDRELLRALVALQAPKIPERAMARMSELEVAPALDFAYSLRLVERDWREADRVAYFTWLGQAKVASGGMSFRGYVEAIEKDALSHVAESQRALLTRLATAPKRELPTLEGIADAQRAWTAAELEPYLPLVEKGRSFEAGRTAFTTAVCFTCHRFDGKGGDIGPDLTAVSSRLSRRDLLTAILEPSRDISDQYEATTFHLRDGKVVIGRPVRSDDVTVEVMIEPITQAKQTLRVGDILRSEASTTSPMPPALLNLLNLEGVLDLLAYLESGGNPNHPAFGK